MTNGYYNIALDVSGNGLKFDRIFVWPVVGKYLDNAGNNYNWYRGLGVNLNVVNSLIILNHGEDNAINVLGVSFKAVNGACGENYWYWPCPSGNDANVILPGGPNPAVQPNQCFIQDQSETTPKNLNQFCNAQIGTTPGTNTAAIYGQDACFVAKNHYDPAAYNGLDSAYGGYCGMNFPYAGKSPAESAPSR